VIAESTPVAVVWPPGLEAIYREDRLRLVRLAFLICGSRQEADDIVQDAVARVAVRWHDVEHGRAYLQVAVANGARDHLRRLRRHRVEVLEAELVAAADPNDPEGVDLARALARLSHDQRAAVVLRYFQGWTDEEIADALGARPATVRSWLRRARTHLRKDLEITDG